MDSSIAYNFAETYKLNAYREVAFDVNEAKSIVENKGLVFGEAACVPFHYPDASTDNNTTRLLIGIGSLDGTTEYFSNVIDASTDVSEAVVYVNEADEYMPLTEAISYAINARS